MLIRVHTQASTCTPIECMSARHEYPLSDYLHVLGVVSDFACSNFKGNFHVKSYLVRIRESLAREHQLASEQYCTYIDK